VPGCGGGEEHLEEEQAGREQDIVTRGAGSDRKDGWQKAEDIPVHTLVDETISIELIEDPRDNRKL
jgi:hypothetical protein